MTYMEMFEKAKAALMTANVAEMQGHTAIQFTVTGDGEGIFYAEITDGVLAVEPYDYMDNNANMTVASEVLAALLEKKQTLAEAAVEVQGNAEAVAALLEAIPAPKKEEKAEAVEAVKEAVVEAAAPVKEAAKTTKKASKTKAAKSTKKKK